jgi:N utilization substance protein A
VRLASQLTGWQIDIMTEEEESVRRQKEFAERTALFMEALDADEMMAQLLASEGFVTVEDIAFIDTEQLAEIEGFGVELAEELQSRARDFLDRIAQEQDNRRVELGVQDDVLTVPGVTLPMAVALGEGQVFSVEDLAGLVGDDLRGYSEIKNGERVKVPGILEKFDLSEDDANAMILEARVMAGWIERPAAPDDAEGEGALEEAEADS